VPGLIDRHNLVATLDRVIGKRYRSSRRPADNRKTSLLGAGQVLGSPTLFIDGVVHRRGYNLPTLLAALATSE
jgi:hypothetical protein